LSGVAVSLASSTAAVTMSMKRVSGFGGVVWGREVGSIAFSF
jgi:hypothetical protein